MIIRGEMGAIILALRALPPDTPATIYTDSLSTLWIIKRWLRRDFGYCLDEEGHPDLVRRLVRALHRRRATRTDLVWVPAHVGEPGNEVVDMWAKAGVDREAPAFDRTCPDIEFWTPGRNLINFLGWRAATTRWANRTSWEHTAQHLRATSKAASTQSLLRPDRARATLGRVLQNRNRNLDERAVRRFIQARGFNTPVQAVLSRNSGGTVSARCPFCGQGDETLGHFQLACSHFHDMRCVAHNTVATATLEAVFKGLRGRMDKEQRSDVTRHPDVWLDTAMWDIYPVLRHRREGRFRPDGLVLDHDRREILILELTRGMDANEQGWRDKADAKFAAYHATYLFLQAHHPGYRIRQTNFVVGVLGSVVESEWMASLELMAISDKDARAVIEKAVLAAVEAFDVTLSVRSGAREALWGQEAGFSLHPSLGVRPPA